MKCGKFPCGPETRKKAAETEAGKLAILLNDILYVADTQPSEHKYCSPRLVMPTKLLTHAPVPKSIPIDGSNYVDTIQVIRAIRDYLEWVSFQEVIP